MIALYFTLLIILQIPFQNCIHGLLPYYGLVSSTVPLTLPLLLLHCKRSCAPYQVGGDDWDDNGRVRGE